MKVIRATTLYDGSSELHDRYIGFDQKIEYVGKEKPEGEFLGEGVVTPAFIDGHSHIGMARAGEPSNEDEANETMDSIYPIVNALHSVYKDDHAFVESVENGILYSTILPGSGNPIGGKGVLVRNFGLNIADSYVMDIGIKAALGYNPRSTKEWEGKRPTTRMGAVGLLRENFIKARNFMEQVKKKKKIEEETDPVLQIFIDLLRKKTKMMVHLHREDDLMVLFSLQEEFGFEAIVNHALDIYRIEPFQEMKKRGLSLVYGPMDAHPYKVELKHESWRNAGLVLRSGVNFCMMSDHPVILQRNLFLTLRHFMRFGMAKPEAISHLTSKAAEILGIDSIGSVSAGKLASLVLWEGDPFSFSGHPRMVIGEGRIVHEE
jgi:imidazolonepropionase-like amidohydrolase